MQNSIEILDGLKKGKVRNRVAAVYYSITGNTCCPDTCNYKKSII